MSINKNKIGATSLGLSALGMLFFYVLTIYYKDRLVLQMFLAGFEAAVVGGVADWFAVTALFREIPIPLFKKHTNIIVKSRDKLTTGIVSLVAEEWLSKESVLQRVNQLLSIRFIAEQFKSKGNHQLLLNTAHKALIYSLQRVNSKQTEKVLTNVLSNILEPEKINNFIVDVGLSLLNQNKQEKPIQFILTKSEEALQSEVVLLELERVVNNQVENYKNNKSSLTKLFVGVTQTVGGLDSKTVALKIQEGLCAFVKKVKIDKTHPMRLEIDNELFALVNTLEGKKKIRSFVDKHIPMLMAKFINETTTTNLLKIALATINNKESSFNKRLELLVTEKANIIADDKEQLQKIRSFITGYLLNIINQNHHLIANTVNENLNQLTNQDLINQIEDKVGTELQYIRLNGAIIGGVVGCLLFLLKHIFH